MNGSFRSFPIRNPLRVSQALGCLLLVQGVLMSDGFKLVSCAAERAAAAAAASRAEPTPDNSTPSFTAATSVALRDGRWLINGQVTYPGAATEGLLMNVRMVNATFEDRNRSDFNADANTEAFLKVLPQYVEAGVRAFTFNLQGGMPGYEKSLNSAFEPDGTLRAGYLARMARVIEACDCQGVVVILGCYYQRQDQVLRDEDAVRRGVVNTVRWITAQRYRNVVLEVANEFGHGGYDHSILRTAAGQVELIELARRENPSLLISTSGLGSGRLPTDVIAACDFLLPHFNNTPVEEIPRRIQTLQVFGKPIVCNEDDKMGDEAAEACRLSVENGASYGLMLSELNQYQPFEFHGRQDDPVFYDTLKSLTEPRPPLVRFAAPYQSPHRVDSAWPFQLVNQEGEHIFILNKTAWAYFGCSDPQGVLDRARSQGVNVLRVALEGTPYEDALGIELWPFGGTRTDPDWAGCNEAYWTVVEERVRLAGENGIGLDVVLYMRLHPQADDVPQQRPYWRETLRRLGKYANILTWEIANEYTANEAFQDAAGTFFKSQDPYQRPVCSSDGTTDDAVWPDKPWMDLAINHTCTSSTARHDLRDWYLALARNTRSHGKPAFCNESGREKRHRNDDGVHRRKQGWLWCAAGGFWTWHSWDGCEGINDLAYRAPGEEFLRPMADFFRSLPFSRMNPNFTACVADDPGIVQAALATADRSHVLAYFAAPGSGQVIGGGQAHLRLPSGTYQVTFVRPADGSVIETREFTAKGLGDRAALELPQFTDDLAVLVQRSAAGKRTLVPGTG